MVEWVLFWLALWRLGGRHAAQRGLLDEIGLDTRVFCNAEFHDHPLEYQPKTGWTGFDKGVQGNSGPPCYIEDNAPLTSAHSGGVLACRADGSVQFLADTTTLDVLARLATRDDGQVVQLD